MRNFAKFRTAKCRIHPTRIPIRMVYVAYRGTNFRTAKFRIHPTRIPIRIVYVAYRGTNFRNCLCSRDQSVTELPMFRGLVFTAICHNLTGIALFGSHRTVKLAVRGKMLSDLPKWKTNLFFSFIICRNIRPKDSCFCWRSRSLLGWIFVDRCESLKEPWYELSASK
jgi:hypothetical protein